MAPTVATWLSRKKNRDNSFNDDLGSVCFAVLAFLSIGFILFSLCFIVTKTLQCYKQHERKKKRREMGGEEEEVMEITEDESSAESADHRPTAILVKASGLSSAQEDERRLMRH